MEEQTLKQAWIDDVLKVIFFLDTPKTRPYTAAEKPFWLYIMDLVKLGYRIG